MLILRNINFIYIFAWENTCYSPRGYKYKNSQANTQTRMKNSEMLLILAYIVHANFHDATYEIKVTDSDFFCICIGVKTSCK